MIADNALDAIVDDVQSRALPATVDDLPASTRAVFEREAREQGVTVEDVLERARAASQAYRDRLDADAKVDEFVADVRASR